MLESGASKDREREREIQRRKEQSECQSEQIKFVSKHKRLSKGENGKRAKGKSDMNKTCIRENLFVRCFYLPTKINGFS